MGHKPQGTLRAKRQFEALWLGATTPLVVRYLGPYGLADQHLDTSLRCIRGRSSSGLGRGLRWLMLVPGWLNSNFCSLLLGTWSTLLIQIVKLPPAAGGAHTGARHVRARN